jgi:lipoprotein NlpI
LKLRLAASLAALIVTLGAAAGASEQPLDVRAEIASTNSAYQRGDSDGALAGTERIIAAPNATAAQRAEALVLHANILFLSKRDAAGAIADMNAALALFPANPSWLVVRGAYRSTAGEPELALGDLDKAITLEPGAWEPYAARGLARLHLMRFAEAASDLQRALELQPGKPFIALALHIARLRLGQDDAPEFAHNTAAIDQSRWPAPLIGFFRGVISGEALLAMAGKNDGSDRTEIQCEAPYYVGEAVLAAGDRARARALFQTAKDACPMDYSEWSGAIAELAQLT